MYITNGAKGKEEDCRDAIQSGICYGSVEMRGDGRKVNEVERVGEEKRWFSLI